MLFDLNYVVNNAKSVTMFQGFVIIRLWNMYIFVYSDFLLDFFDTSVDIS